MDEIVFLDTATIGTVVNFKLLKKLGKINLFDETTPGQVVERSMGKEIVITNKVEFTAEVIDQLPDLKLICVAATGLNNVDLDHAAKKGIQVKNVVNYSSDSVAQLTFTMLLFLVNRPGYYDNYVKSGAYAKSSSFTHHGEPFWELRGKRIGIIGLGTIGRQVARIAESFGMEVVFYSTTGRNNNINYKRFELDDLLKNSDVISIPAKPQNANPVGEWNSVEIICFKGTVIHFQNGEKVLEYHLWTHDWNKLVAGSKFPELNKDWANVATEGYIGLQDHGDDVWYRNIRIKEK